MPCAGSLLRRLLLFWSTGSRAWASVVVARGLSYLKACGIFPNQGSNSYRPPSQADSLPLDHQGSPLSPSFSIKHISCSDLSQAASVN